MSAPQSYGPSAGYHAPPGQTYPDGTPHTDAQYQRYNSPPRPRHASYDQDGHPLPPGYVPPHRPPPSSYDPNNFPPPPTSDYRDDYEQGPPRSEYDRGYDRPPPGDHETQRGGSIYDERPYAPENPSGHEGNQMTPYDEDKAEAEYFRGQAEDQRRRYPQPAPPPSDYYERRDPRYDDRDRRYDDDRSYDDRRRYDDRYDDRRTLSDDRSYDDRDRRNTESRRRESRTSASGIKKDIFGAREGQRGISAQILGGAMGGLAGHEFGGGLIETLGGMAVGALGAKALENQHEKRRTKNDKAMQNVAPLKHEAVTGSRYPSSRPPPRDDRRDYDRRDYGRDGGGRSQRSRSRRRGDSRSDSYSSESPPPPRR